MTDSVAEGAPAGPAEIVAGRAPEPGRARFGPVFAVVTAGIVVVNLDLFIVNVALPSIGRDFHGTDLASLSWVLNAYAIVFAALLVPAGRAADLIGRRAAFLTGMIVFAVASAACAAAPDVWVLVGARVVQAAGGALLMPASLSLLLAAAPAGAPHGRDPGLDLRRRRRRRARPGRRGRAGGGELALGVPGERPDHRHRAGRRPPGPPA